MIVRVGVLGFGVVLAACAVRAPGANRRSYVDAITAGIPAFLSR